MSDHKLVSPLLDGLITGDPIASHDGVHYFPAMKESTKERYIVKIISVPASQTQLDALLLTGACKDAAAAAEYFNELTEDIVQEAKLLQQLSRLGGFLAYENWQVVPMEDNKLGYDVYLLGSYRNSLEEHLRSSAMTHLGAVNLGLDLCSALANCRRAGYLHIDLKPENVFLSGEREYRIGDLGFARLKSLKYAGLPGKYRSGYTPPELHDEMATLNPTVDIYAVGMILYRIYNNSRLPFEDHAANEVLPAPANADYEMAEIIMKACHPNPRHRWQTPIEMGQALAAYMQRNTVNDVPIVPPAAEVPAAEPEGDANSDEQHIPETEAAETHEELVFMNDLVSDETAPGEEDITDLPAGSMTEEFQEVVSQADDLIGVEEPAAEEKAEETADEAKTEDTADEKSETGDTSEEKPADSDLDPDTMQFLQLLKTHGVTKSESEEPELPEPDTTIRKKDDHASIGESTRKKGRGWVSAIVLLLILAIIGGGAWYYYTNYYLLPIDTLDITVAEDSILVDVDTAADESLLTVVCTDTYGNTLSQPLEDGSAVFTELNAGSQYQITVAASGFHQTSGNNSGSCATAKQTQVVDFLAKTGNEDGSVILNFTIDGPEAEEWIIEYSAADEEPKSMTFTGHMATVTGLTLDKVYTFQLTSASDLWLVGSTTLDYTARKSIVAEKVNILSCSDGQMSLEWTAPADAAVESWTVRCYDDSGYDETITVTETAATFTGINAENAHTVEVTAAGMTQSARAYLSANATTITDISVTEDDGLKVSWTYSGNVPEGGWLLMYSVDGVNSEVVSCTASAGTISNLIPGATYDITIQTAAGSTVFGGTTKFTCAQAPAFEEHSLSVDEIMVSLCETPGEEGWNYKDVDDYATTFSSGSDISMVVYASAKFYRPEDEKMEMMFIIRDSEGHVRTDLMSKETIEWRSIWEDGYAYLDIPAVPAEAGEYTVDLYWYGGLVTSKNFTITE